MTPLERINAAIAGAPVDRKPTISWPVVDPSCDVAIWGLQEIPLPRSSHMVLAPIANPFGRALAEGTNLSVCLREDLDAGQTLLERYAAEVTKEIESAIKEGADGIIYVVYGATPEMSTPMEFGGHFLEVDRKILESFRPAAKMAFIIGGEGAFLDFVSDLPTDIFAWDVHATGVAVGEVRAMRKGALAASDPQADILLTYPGDIGPNIHPSSLIRQPSIAHV